MADVTLTIGGMDVAFLVQLLEAENWKCSRISAQFAQDPMMVVQLLEAEEKVPPDLPPSSPRTR